MGNSAVASAPAEAEARPAPPGPIIDRTQGKIIANRYRLEDTILGTGAFAVVKLGTDLESNRHVAIRIVDKEKLSPVGSAYLRAECEVYKDLDHPSIVKCYLIKEGKKYVIFVTEYMPDGNLSNHFSKKAMVREIEARDIFEQIISALQYLHGRGIVWRDLKSSNILLDLEKKAVKICDFGFAARMESGKMFTDFPGTMAYSPPEVLSATPYEGAPRDVWSLGVFLYKMLTGKYPFGSRTNPNTRHRIIESEPEIESLFISDAAKELLRGMLQKNPTQRLTLQAIQQSEWMNAPPASLAPKKRANMAPTVVTKKPSVLVRQCSIDSAIGSAVQKGDDVASGFVMIPRGVAAVASPRAGADMKGSISTPIPLKNPSPAPREGSDSASRTRTNTQPAQLSSPRNIHSPARAPRIPSSPEGSSARSRTNTQPLPQLSSPRSVQQIASSPPQPQQPLLQQPPQAPKPTVSFPLSNSSPPATSNIPHSSTVVVASTAEPSPSTETQSNTSSTPTAHAHSPSSLSPLIPDLPTPSFIASPPVAADSTSSTQQQPPPSNPLPSLELPGSLSQPIV